MKKYNLKNIVFYLILFCNVIAVSAQEKKDTVIMLNGEKKEGTITLIKDDAIKIMYKGETVEHELKKFKINTIVFANGRTEVINKEVKSKVVSTGRKGKIAILPLEFISNDHSISTNFVYQ